LKLEPGATDDPDAHAATVRCEGKAVEYYCEGRRPIGHVERRPLGESLGEHLARCAELEASAVTAFDDVIAALERWRAPDELIAPCRQASAQEVEHAHAMDALARRHGGSPQTPRREHREIDRFTLALDNAIEGCVNEAWAALRARWIAEHARDPDVRELYTLL